MQPRLISLVLCAGLYVASWGQQPASDSGSENTSSTHQATDTNKTEPDAEGVYRIGHGVTVPKLTHQVKAKYSAKAEKAKFSGYVEFKWLSMKMEVSRTLGF